MAFGLVMILEALDLIRPTAAIAMGTTPLETYYIGRGIQFNFPYPGFGWLPLLPESGMKAVVALQVLAGAAVLFGAFYRVASKLLFLTWAYFFLVESTRTYWQNSQYLLLLLAFIMVWVPAAEAFSIDAARRDKGRKSSPRTIPFWPVFLLRGQLFFTYFYAGVAKLNYDWLLDAVPVRWFLQEAHVAATLKGWVSPAAEPRIDALLRAPELAFFLSYAGLVFDLSVGFLLLIPRTRFLALALLALFHGFNYFVLFRDIGWLPLTGFLTALIFLSPRWPENFGKWLKKPVFNKPDWRWFATGAVLVPGVGALLGWKPREAPAAPQPAAPAARGRGPALFVSCWLLAQALIPLRGHLIPGDARFTYEGSSFSWRFKTEFREAVAAQFTLNDPEVLAEKDGQVQINWGAWPGERRLYRQLQPGRVDWRALPEVFVTLDPLLGERIFYRAAPSADPAAVLSEVRATWRETFGREPTSIQPTESAGRLLGEIATGLRLGGHTTEATLLLNLLDQSLRAPAAEGSLNAAAEQLQQLLKQLLERNPSGELLTLLQKLQPFGLEGERPGTNRFVLIEDLALMAPASGTLPRVDSGKWRTPKPPGNGSASRSYEGAEPLLVHLAPPGRAARTLLPLVYLVEQHPSPKAPVIQWNILRDVTDSKLIHISSHPYYLHRYALRVRKLWGEGHQRDVSVHALARLSLNRRPHQELVDPAEDLASIEYHHLRHNPWVRELLVERIPRERLSLGGR